jgi:hypothetical protein
LLMPSRWLSQLPGDLSTCWDAGSHAFASTRWPTAAARHFAQGPRREIHLKRGHRKPFNMTIPPKKWVDPPDSRPRCLVTSTDGNHGPGTARRSSTTWRDRSWKWRWMLPRRAVLDCLGCSISPSRERWGYD